MSLFHIFSYQIPCLSAEFFEDIYSSFFSHNLFRLVRLAQTVLMSETFEKYLRLTWTISWEHCASVHGYLLHRHSVPCSSMSQLSPRSPVLYMADQKYACRNLIYFSMSCRHRIATMMRHGCRNGGAAIVLRRCNSAAQLPQRNAILGRVAMSSPIILTASVTNVSS